MQEIACPNCGKTIKGQAELCLFCGKRLDGTEDNGGGAETGGGFPFWVLVVVGVVMLLCCGLTVQSGAISGVTTRLQDFAGAVSPSAEATQTLVPTNTPEPTHTSTPTRTPTPEATSTPTPTSSPEPTPTPTRESIPTPTPSTPLLPDSGRAMSWPQAVWVIGTVMVLFGWGWNWLWHRKKRERGRSQG